ncbi:protein Wnt-8a isoform X2 [Phaenicophaeus curvirostris]|uniref:protein Wnt-8a isoform X2 n=1 Tax=Phaenicophaeus curvirostris TaxID=33595 RepID=UPI0037F0B7E5
MKRSTFLILFIAGVYSTTLHAAAWSVNNFLMTGPKAYLTYSSSVAAGAHSGMEECKFQFGWERWNCPESALQLSTHNRLRSATRETSFVHAISSAGVMYTLTRNCSMGDFESCGCDDSRNGRVGGRGWVWGGCSDNVEFGERISKLFVDALETGHDTRALINLHNNEVGRLAVKSTMKRTCKCHGVSGSCSIQTCWLQLAEFREIGNYLKIKYNQAHKLEMDKRRMRAGNSADSRGATAETFHHVDATELVFLEDSPDYCTRNASLGHHGTEGRECLQTGKNLSHWERRSCRRLCTECGLRVEERRTEVVASCNCKFHWCCTVRCEQCRQLVAKYFCARRDASAAAPTHSRRKNKGHKR